MKKAPMVKTCVALQLLKLYLVDKGLKVPLNMRIKHDSECDALNDEKPRSFCFVKRGSQVIHCAAALEVVPELMRFGILLHEISHLAADAFDRTAEIDADTWIKKNVPEAEFEYQDVGYSNEDDESRLFKSIETVSPDFIRELHERYEIYSEFDKPRQLFVCDRTKVRRV